ncbi:MAG: molybdopterin molybdotransferase MoeA [Acidimicrobiia bacterium]
MIPLKEAQAIVLGGVAPLPVVEVPVPEGIGLTLAGDIVAGESIPPFANTAVDGYAVRATNTHQAAPDHPVRLPVVDELPAGRTPSRPLLAGEAIRIMTGAPVPEGADAMVMVEDTSRDGDGGVFIKRPAKVGDHVRPAGGDVAPGDSVFLAGTVLRAAHLGVLSSLGLTSIAVHRRPRVALISTGDELADPGEPLTPGRIRDSNRPMLLALVAGTGCQAVDFGVVTDDEAAITEALESALSSCDAIVTTGGVSMGDYDFVKVVVERLGELRWLQVAIRPAKPLAFGLVGGRPILGLPGNPVSSHVSFELFARPALMKLMGRATVNRPALRATAAEPLRRQRDGKLHLDRVRLSIENGRLFASRSGVQASNVLTAMAAADGLVLLPDGEGVDAGEEVDVLHLGFDPT